MTDTFTWFVPSFWGDIRLTPAQSSKGKTTSLVAEKLSDPEKAALAALTIHARKKAWIHESVTLGEGAFHVKAPVDKVAKVIAKVLKPDRKLISAVVFTDGTMEEHREADTEPVVPVRPDAVLPPKRGRPRKAATTVAAPTRGCPAPDFEAAEIRAQRVLESFLVPAQIDDFRRYNRFVSIGHSGRRYMVTSRHARDQLATYHRSLYDLDDKVPLCVHDWDVPAPEEMLAIHVLLSLPGWELYMRRLEGEDGEVSTLFVNGREIAVRDHLGRDIV